MSLFYVFFFLCCSLYVFIPFLEQADETTRMQTCILEVTDLNTVWILGYPE